MGALKQAPIGLRDALSAMMHMQWPFSCQATKLSMQNHVILARGSNPSTLDYQHCQTYMAATMDGSVEMANAVQLKQMQARST